MRTWILSTILISVFNNSNGQISKVGNRQYDKFLIKGESVLALTSSGELRLIDFDKSRTREKRNTLLDKAICCVAIDNYGNIYAGTFSNEIKSYDISGGVSQITETLPERPYDLFFDKSNRMYSLSKSGVRNHEAFSTSLPQESRNRQSPQTGQGWQKAPIAIIDKSERIWIGFQYGESGGEIYVYDCKSNSFSLPAMDEDSLLMGQISGFAITQSGVVAAVKGSKSGVVDAGLEKSTTIYTYKRQAGRVDTSLVEIIEQDQNFDCISYDKEKKQLYLSAISGIYILPVGNNHEGEKPRLLHKTDYSINWETSTVNDRSKVVQSAPLNSGNLLVLTRDGRLALLNNNLILYLSDVTN